MVRRNDATSTSLRIAFVVPGYATGSEGLWAIPALSDHIRCLASQHEVRVFALRYPAARAPWLLDGARIRTFAGGDARGIESGRLLARALAGITLELRSWRPHVVHGLWADEPGAIAAAAGRMLRVPSVVSLMGGEPCRLEDIGYGGLLGRRNRLLLSYSLRTASVVTTGSDYLAALIRPRLHGRTAARMPLGVDTALFQPAPQRGREAGAPHRAAGARLLCVASLTPVKDPLLALRSLSLLRDDQPRVHLDVVGDGPLRPELALVAERLGVAGMLTMHGAISRAELPARYRAADLLVQSSRHESQGMTVLEAAACGCPAVGTAVGILPELPGARVTPPGDAGALAEAVRALLQDAGARAAAGEAACTFVRSGLDVEQTTAAGIALYRRLLAAAPGRYNTTSL
ncbi:MAG: glycosyltransferase family 4 protein [Gemmatimonadota bacterium]